MKKNVFVLFMPLILTALLCACSYSRGEASGKPLNQYLIAESIKLTCAMDSLAESGAHMELSASLSQMSEVITELGAGGYTAPNKAVLIKVSGKTVKSTYEKWLGKLNLPDDVYDMLMRKTCASVVNIINSRHGANVMAANMLSLDKSFLLHKDFTGSVYVLLLYDKHCSMTFFSKSGEGVMSASTTFLFLPDDIKKSITDGKLAGLISEELGVNGIETEYIDGESATSNMTDEVD